MKNIQVIEVDMLPQIIQQENRKHVFEILEQKIMRQLLQSLKDLPKSAQQLATDCDIPLSTTYRMINELARLNIIKVKHVFNESGKWEKRYKCNEFFLECIRNQSVTNELTNSKSDLM
jgi:response regulator of citrate/malate metabolism